MTTLAAPKGIAISLKPTGNPRKAACCICSWVAPASLARCAAAPAPADPANAVPFARAPNPPKPEAKKGKVEPKPSESFLVRLSS